MNAPPILRSKRITSIDALRAFVLLGVLLTHLWAGFNVEDAYQVNSVTDMAIDGFIPRSFPISIGIDRTSPSTTRGCGGHRVCSHTFDTCSTMASSILSPTS